MQDQSNESKENESESCTSGVSNRDAIYLFSENDH